MHLPVDVRNEGDRAAASVQVVASWRAEDGTELSAEQTIDFLGAGASERVVFVIVSPAHGTPPEGLTVEVRSFAVP